MPVEPSTEEEVRAMGSGGAIGTLRFTLPAQSMPIAVRMAAERWMASVRVESVDRGFVESWAARDAASGTSPGRIRCLPGTPGHRHSSGLHVMAKRIASLVCEGSSFVHRCPARSVPVPGIATPQWSRPPRHPLASGHHGHCATVRGRLHAQPAVPTPMAASTHPNHQLQ